MKPCINIWCRNPAFIEDLSDRIGTVSGKHQIKNQPDDFGSFIVDLESVFFPIGLIAIWGLDNIGSLQHPGLYIGTAFL